MLLWFLFMRVTYMIYEWMLKSFENLNKKSWSKCFAMRYSLKRNSVLACHFQDDIIDNSG